jgi:hypothetical protein
MVRGNMAKLSPIVSEFESDEEAEAYDRWFRAKVQDSVDNPGRLIPHDEAMARITAKIEAVIRAKSQA